MPDAPLTEDEAENALLAMGPQLEWKHSAAGTFYHATIRHHAYDVWTADTRYGWIANFFINGGHIETKAFIHVATAKAACERHHATGKWD